MTNIIILPSSLFQQFGQWSDTRSWKTRSMSVPLSLKLLQTNSCVFVFLVPVFEGPLHSKVALLVFVFGRMWWKLFTFTRGSHTFTLTRGEISSECVTKGVIGRTSAEYDEESEISIKWIWNSWSSRLYSLRYIPCFPLFFLAYIANSAWSVLQKRFLYDLGVDLSSWEEWRG